MKLVKYFFIFILASTLFSSCSPKVITITETRVDTLYKDSISFVTQIEKCQLDTSFNLIGHGVISVKLDSNRFSFNFKPEKIVKTEVKTEIPKDVVKQNKRQEERTNRTDIRQSEKTSRNSVDEQNKTKRDSIKQEEKTDRTDIRQGEKTDRTKIRAENKTGFFNWLKRFWKNILRIGIAFVIGYILSKFKIFRIF